MQKFLSIVSAYSDYVAKVKEHLEKIIRDVSDGFIPKAHEIEDACKDIEKLRQNYEDLLAFSNTILSSDELPPVGSRFNDYVEAIKRSKAQSQREDVRKKIQRFIQIRSSHKTTAEAISKHQNMARELLKCFEEIELDELLKETEGIQLILTAIERDDPDSEESFKDFVKIGNFYHDEQITWGLSRSHYTLPESDNSAQSEENENNPTVDTIPEERNTNATSVIEKPAKASTHTLDQISSRRILIPTNKPKNGTPSASSFIREITKLIRWNAGIKFVLFFLRRHGILSRNMLLGLKPYFFKEPHEQDIDALIEKAIDLLAVKGYLVCFNFSIDDKENQVYGLSKYTCDCLLKKTVKEEFPNLSKGIFNKQIISSEQGADAELIEEICANNEILFELIPLVHDLYGSKVFHETYETIEWDEDHYRLSFPKDKTPYSGCYLTKLNSQIVQIDAEKLILVTEDEVEFPNEFHPNCTTVIFVSPGKAVVFNPRTGEVISEKTNVEKSEEDNRETTISESDKLLIDVEELEEEAGNMEDPSALNEDNSLELNETDENTNFRNPEYPDLENQKANFIPLEGKTIPTESEKQEEESISEKLTLVTLDETEDPTKPLIDRLIQREDTPTEEEFIEILQEMLGKSASNRNELNKVIANTTLLAKTIRMDKKRQNVRLFTKQIRLATNLLISPKSYSGAILSEAFEDLQACDPALVYAAYFRAMITPDEEYDYVLSKRIQEFTKNFRVYFQNIPEFEDLFKEASAIYNINQKGFTIITVAQLTNKQQVFERINTLKQRASDLMTMKAPNLNLCDWPRFFSSCFGRGSALYECLSFVEKNITSDDHISQVESLLSNLCRLESNTYTIDSAKIRSFIDQTWRSITGKDRFELRFDGKALAERAFTSRIHLLIDWLETTKSTNVNLQDLSAVRNRILTCIENLQKETTWKKVKNASVLYWLLESVRDYLNGVDFGRDIYAELLLTGRFRVGDDWMPEIDESMENVAFFEPWRNTLLHISAVKKSPKEVQGEIFGEGQIPEEGKDSLLDNLHQYEMLARYLGFNDENYKITEKQIEQAKRFADEHTKTIKNQLELAFAYDQVTEIEKENILGFLAKYQDTFYNQLDFASYRRFLGALEKQITKSTNMRKKELYKAVRSRFEQDQQRGARLFKTIHPLLENNMNFAVVEEYINRFDRGETINDGDGDFILYEENYFKKFLAMHGDIYENCKNNQGTALHNFGNLILNRITPKTWTTRQRNNSGEIFEIWPRSLRQSKDEILPKLITWLGFKADKKNFEIVAQNGIEIASISVFGTERNLTDYPHPIAHFGTQINNTLKVVLFYGNYTEHQLVDNIINLKNVEFPIVLLDRALQTTERRTICELFFTNTSRKVRFLLIDRVLILFLAHIQKTERLTALLQCTLPYTSYQPFLRDGGSIPDEMFVGRIQELNTIIDLNGACVVYGGRQLGKTALLERAESLCSKPESMQYAVYSNVYLCKSEDDVVNKLIDDISKKTNEKIQLTPVNSLKELCSQLSERFRKGQIQTMHLFIDEVDNFLAGIADMRYIPLEPLLELRRETKNRFKFVLTGLHNVSRAQNATRENGIFGHLGIPLCIKPLSPSDSMKLLMRPLSFLGFITENNTHLATILPNTNYYPGILQFFGYSLVDSLANNYAKFYSATMENPPYTLQENQIAEIINSENLNQEIKKKFHLTLELDIRYFMIAHVVAYMMLSPNPIEKTNQNGLGFSAEDIFDMAVCFEINCFSNENLNSFTTLLDEMVDMGVLSRPTNKTYRLRRRNFIESIGRNPDEIEKEIKIKNEEGA